MLKLNRHCCRWGWSGPNRGRSGKTSHFNFKSIHTRYNCVYRALLADSLKLIPAGAISWALASAIIKVPILHFYLTVFRPNKLFRGAVHGAMTLVVSFGVGGLLSAFLICRPFAKNWNRSLPGVCGSSVSAELAGGIINISTKLVIIILRMPLIWYLQMAYQKRLGLTILFGFGHM